MDSSEYQVLLMTASSTDEAHAIADRLVNERLAACVNIVDKMTSVYRWKGDIVKDAEALMIAKTRRADFDRIKELVTELHSYDVPEIIGFDLTSIAEPYRDFLKDVLG